MSSNTFQKQVLGFLSNTTTHFSFFVRMRKQSGKLMSCFEKLDQLSRMHSPQKTVLTRKDINGLYTVIK